MNKCGCATENDGHDHFHIIFLYFHFPLSIWFGLFGCVLSAVYSSKRIMSIYTGKWKKKKKVFQEYFLCLSICICLIVVQFAIFLCFPSFFLFLFHFYPFETHQKLFLACCTFNKVNFYHQKNHKNKKLEFNGKKTAKNSLKNYPQSIFSSIPAQMTSFTEYHQRYNPIRIQYIA